MKATSTTKCYECLLGTAKSYHARYQANLDPWNKLLSLSQSGTFFFFLKKKRVIQVVQRRFDPSLNSEEDKTKQKAAARLCKVKNYYYVLYIGLVLHMGGGKK